MQVLGVAALRGDQRALLGVVEVGQAGVVELEVGAAELAEPAHLLGVRRGEVGPERLEVGVDRLVDRGPAAAVVDHVGRGDGQLRDLVPLDHRLQELERVAEDRVAQPDPVVDAERRRLEVEVARLVVEVHGELLVGRVDALELVDEVHVPRRTPELAVGRGAQAGLPLERHDVADRGVLDLLEARRRRARRSCAGRGRRGDRGAGAGSRRGRRGTAGACGRAMSFATFDLDGAGRTRIVRNPS